MPRIYRGQGFSLVELIITVVFFSILLGALWLVYDSGFRPYYSHEERTGIKGEMSRSLISLAQDLRQASAMTTAQLNNLTVSVDSDDDGVVESIQYTWSGASGAPLERISGSTTPLVHSVSSLAFSYYDASNNLLTFPVTASQVRVVSIDLTAIDQDETFQLRTQTRLRNLS